MPSVPSDPQYWFESIPETANQLIVDANSDEELVDLLGEMRRAEKGLAQLRTDTAAEVEPTSGERWEMTQGTRNVYSFNGTRLLAKILGEGGLGDGSLITALQLLMDRGVIDFKWKYTPLIELLEEIDVGVNIAYHKVEEGDTEYDIGRVKLPGYPSYSRKEIG